MQTVTRGLTLSSINDSKIVTKKWGSERWLLYENSPFAVKLLNLKAGFRTSLQYHEKKEEFLLMLQGHVKMYYADETKTLKVVELQSGDMAHIKPGLIHRVEAITDATYAEASTMELDDVIRLEDDFGRPNGHIAEEHT